jgi:hypothetical protein
VGCVGGDALLGEVKTLQPNSEGRVEAIKRAERARAREMELRRENEFQVELGELVTEGKLKTQGEGAKRIEKEREEKEKQIRQELWEREKKRLQQQEEKEKEKEGVPADTTDPTTSENDERGVKRTVSEGRSAFATATEIEDAGDGVMRSISHSSGLSRMKRISTSAAKRFSVELSKMGSNPSSPVEEEEEGTADAGVGGN